MRILIVDNYDSFTYNLVQAFGVLGAEVEVFRNDAASLAALVARRPHGVVISPGPGRPEQAGVSLAAVRRFASARIPLLGVCLGHQAVGLAFGATLRRARQPMHGKTSEVRHVGAGLYQGAPEPLVAMRYHSLVLDEKDVPASLQVTAWTDDGEIMGVRHAALPVEGVQFHPESIGTAAGSGLLARFLHACAEVRA